MELLPEKYGQCAVMTITEGPDVNAEECGHWYSPAQVARFIEAEREACAKVCERVAKVDYDDNFGAPYECASQIRMRSNVKLTGGLTAESEKANE